MSLANLIFNTELASLFKIGSVEETSKKYGYKGIDDSFLEQLVGAGYNVVPRSEVHRKHNWTLKGPTPYFALYGGKDAVHLCYGVALSKEAKELIKQDAVRRMQESADYDTIEEIREETNFVLDTGHANHFWLEDPKKAEDENYLRTLILTMEGIAPDEALRSYQEKYGVKLRPDFWGNFDPNVMVLFGGLMAIYKPTN